MDLSPIILALLISNFIITFDGNNQIWQDCRAACTCFNQQVIIKSPPQNHAKCIYLLLISCLVVIYLFHRYHFLAIPLFRYHFFSNETILNVLRNYVPNKYITIDDKDPIWMNETIKSKIKARNKLYRQYIENGRFESEFMMIETLITEINDLISATKDIYYNNLAKRLNNPLSQAKTYWSVLKTLYNDKKISIIPPLLIDDKFVTDIQTKANVFNNFFADQCTPLKNGSVLPKKQNYSTQSILCTLNFDEEELIKLIRNLNVHKAHGLDDISIRMIKICDKSILKPLIILFENATKSSYYPDIWVNLTLYLPIKKMTNN